MKNDDLIIGINLKAYETGVGSGALKIARAADEIAEQQDVEIFLCVQPTDIRFVSASVSKIKIFAQHMDNVEPGAHTGHITPAAIKDAGADGVLLNHSEKRLRLDVIEENINLAKKYGLKTLVCANTPTSAKAISCFDIDMVAVEPPELIGGDISVSSARPEVIKKTVEQVREVNTYARILVGAGIKKKIDVRKSLVLGANGVLVASAVAKAKDPKQAILELIP